VFPSEVWRLIEDEGDFSFVGGGWNTRDDKEHPPILLFILNLFDF
jgi:hypothetical protein